ncbi:hypothetical protein DSM104299_00208 [Baekduia alba]|uniref:ester cyclase n=1 Tax=Baekduia alba TaxID=2997333 RepID=UPI0023413276|nr:ester cyclase [Baekduia alba]WCB91537.1 hypothetical protein DSM104299_00208 [Baekduia alba]
MPTAQETSNIAAFHRFHDATNSGDGERIARTIDELVAPDAVIHAPLPMDATGPELLKVVWTGLLRAYPDVHITVEDLIAKDDKIVSRQTVTATHQGEHLGLAPTGRSVSYNEMFIVRYVDGQVAETWGVVDVFAQMKQLGAIDA